jgi:hypothetical protein
MKMAAEEIQPFPAFPEINHLRLVRVQLQPSDSRIRRIAPSAAPACAALRYRAGTR